MLFRALCIALLLSFGFPHPANAEPAVSATYVEGRLLAPCCWTQTLDIHESELATSLRVEIATRVEAGEASTTIEDDLAARYGERIRAVPRGEEPRAKVALLSSVVVLGALAGLMLFLRRWLRRAPASDTTRHDPTDPREALYESRLDEELRALDDA